MQVSSIRFYNFRNLQDASVAFSGGTNLILGRNGQGKTNLLEAIYLLGYGKSFRTSAPKDCIRHGQRICTVEGSMDHGAITRNLQVSISPAKKELRVHGKAAPVEEFVGSLHVVAFTSEHMAIIRGSPAERRGFLDRAMATLYPGHVRYLADFSLALRQRNSMLAELRDQKRGGEKNVLDSWDETLVRTGSIVAYNRSRYVKQLKESLPDRMFGAERIKIHYLSSALLDHGTLPEIQAAYRDRLAQARTSDEAAGFTSVGPHRDDLKVFADGKAVATFGSAGQQRSALLSLYFGQMEIHRQVHGFYPVFMVDDVEAELDDQRLGTFLALIGERTQTFLTTAKAALIPPLSGPLQRFEVASGAVRPA